MQRLAQGGEGADAVVGDMVDRLLQWGKGGTAGTAGTAGGRVAMDLTFSPYILQLAPDADTPDLNRVSAVPVAVHNSLGTLYLMVYVGRCAVVYNMIQAPFLSISAPLEQH